ncbi:hypothetical protein GJR95_16780 [Spirosoma endbachense]|uniref:ATP-binding protein n=2 Tax=Spirosoma endbachense TaxID=2666025 RepID=A0A6P1VYT4_9BACT|nr:hypothetical protein GJR95_16780 [Spirosoma endbachense]
MLSPKSPLTCVKVEGVNAKDSVNIPRKDSFLAADMTEYFGGCDFEKSTQVVITQIKYSTTNAEGKWTLSSLTKRKSKTSRDSVIQRLADSYSDLISNGFNRREIVAKTSIRLVSNQSIDDKLAQSISLIKTAIGFCTVSISYTHFLTLLPAKAHTTKRHLKTLHDLLKLSDEDFFNFLSILDLSGCDSGSRSWQQLATLDDLSESISHFERHSALLELKDLVNSHMLPENASSDGIKLGDVLAALHVAEYKELFPEEPQLSLPNNLIRTDDALRLAQIVSQNTKVLAHGVAGVGKSTTLQQIKAHLPTGSVMVLYDCFGAGNYRNINSGRHTLLRAVMQLSNELSTQTGIPFLTTPPANDKYTLISMFQNRLNKAADLVNKNNGLLVIGIDAADNAVIKATIEGETNSFVPHLWELTLPANCRLVMSARTGDRANSLKAPKETYFFELSGFDTNASAAHFRQVFKNAGAASCQDFHGKTRHNPRIQQYLLEKAKEFKSSFQAFLYVFRHANLVPAKIFEDIIELAVDLSNDRGKAQEYLAIMTCLHRPIPLYIFADSCQLTLDQARLFCESLRPGILFEDDLIEIRDEDFDTHLRVRPETEVILKQTHAKLATHFRTIALTNAYAAQVVAEHYWEAEQYDELIDLVLTGPSLNIITDSLTRISTQEQQIQLALKAAAYLKRDRQGIQLLLLACELKNTNEATRNLVQANISLANQFGKTNNLVSYFDLTNKRSWMGAMHFKLAAAYAKNEAQRSLAEEHLKQGDAWVKRYMRSLDQHGYHWEIYDNDLANETEAVFWLYGVDQAKQSLSRWQPLQSVLASLRICVDQIILWLDDETIEANLVEANLALRSECIVLARLWENKRSVKAERVHRVASDLRESIEAKKIRRRRPRGNSEQSNGLSWAIPISELFATHEVDPAIILTVIDELAPSMPDHAPYRHSNLQEYVFPLRGVTLKSVLLQQEITINDILPSKLQPPSKKSNQPDPNEQDRREFVENIGPILIRYNLLAQTLVHCIDTTTISSQIDEELDNLYRVDTGNRYRFIHRQREWLFGAGQTLANLKGQKDLLNKLFVEAIRVTGRYTARKFWIELGQYLLPINEYKPLGLKWLEEAASDSEADSINIEDRWQLLLHAAEAAFRFDSELSQDLYRRAVKAASEGVSDEVVYRLRFIANQLKTMAAISSSKNNSQLGIRQAAITEAYKPFISGDIDVPLELTLEAVSKLNLSNGLMLFNRWDLNDFLPIEKAIGLLLQGATSSNRWPAWISIPLLRIQGETANWSDLGLKLLDVSASFSSNQMRFNTNKAEVFESLVTWARRDALLRHRVEAIQKLSDWGKQNNLTRNQAVEQLDATLAFVDTLHIDALPAKQVPVYKSPDENFLKWYDRAKQGDFTSFQAEISIQYGMNIPNLRTCLLELGNNITYNQRTDFLELISNLNLYQEHRYQEQYGHLIIHLLAIFLDRWKNVQAVQRWVKQQNGLIRFLAKMHDNIINEGEWPCHLEAFLKLPLVSSSRAETLLPTLADLLPHLNVDRLCRAADVLCKPLLLHDQEYLTDWLLNRLENKLLQDGKALPFNVLSNTSETNIAQEVEDLAQFCWYLFGYPDTRVRWQTVHAVREILSWHANTSLRNTLINRLMELSLTKTSELIPATYEFFWMSALVWLLLLLERLADESPTTVIPHAKSIAAHAFNENLPHVQIRGLAKKTLLRLRKYDEQLFSTEQWQKIEQINTPIACLLNRKRYKVEGDFLHLSKKRADRIKFNHLDVKDYWFEPLGEVFAQSSETVAILAEHWICDRWGYDQESYNQYWEYQNRYDYSLKYLYKTSEPTIDSLETNLTYNAMMCVAGEMVDQLSVLMEDWADIKSKSCWESWFEDQLTNSGPNGWLADLRTPIPLLAECWGKLPEPWKQRTADDFINVLGTKEPGKMDWLVIHGNRDFGYSSRYESEQDRYGDTNVTSVFVSPEMATSLVRAIQAAEPKRYVFPSFGFDDKDAEWKDELPGNFALQPLLVKEKYVYEGLEQKDITRRRAGGIGVRIEPALVRSLSLEVKEKGMTYSDQYQNEIIRFEQWSDDSRDEQYRQENTYSSGFRVWMKWSALRAYMHCNNQVLVIEVLLKRNYSKTNRDNQYDRGKHIVYTLYPNGILESMDRYYSLWAENNS